MGKCVERESRLVERVSKDGVSRCVLNRLVMSNSFVTLWTVAHQAPLSLGFPKQEYWNGLPFPSLEDFPDPGIKPASPSWQTDSLPLSHLGNPSTE